MNFIDNWKISTKIVVVIALLSCVTLMVVALGAISLLNVDGAYSVIVKNDFPASLSLARANRALNAVGYAVYRTIAYDGASAGAKAAAATVETDYASAVQFLARAAESDPSNKAVYDGFKAKAEDIHTIAKSVVAHGLKDENEQATKEMARGDELIEALGADTVKFNNAGIEKADAAGAAASAGAHSTVMMSSASALPVSSPASASACGWRWPRFRKEIALQCAWVSGMMSLMSLLAAARASHRHRDRAEPMRSQ